MQAPRTRIEQHGQGVDVRVLELRDLAILHEKRGQFVSRLGQLLQHTGICRRTAGRFLEHGQLQFLEKNLPQLQRRVDVELLAGRGVNCRFQPAPLALEVPLELREALHVDQNTGPFHVGENGQERHLDLVEQRSRRHGVELRLELVAKPQRDVGVLGGVFGCAIEGDLIIRDIALSFAAEILEGRHLVLEKLERQHVNRVSASTGIEHIARDFGVELQPRELDPRLSQRE